MATFETSGIAISSRLRGTDPIPCLRQQSRPTSSPRNSQGSTKSWEETINEISIGLQQICGSPVASPMSPRFVAPVVEKGSPRSSVAKRLFNRPEFRRAESLYGSVTRCQQQKLVVRHIETQEQLKNKLSAICRRDSDTLSTSDISPDSSFSELSVRSALAFSSPSFRLKVDLKSVPIEDLTVSILHNKMLRLEALQGPKRVLLESNLPDGIDISRLSCTVTDKETLVIRERTKESMKLEYSESSCVYLPLVFADETKHELTVVTHLPSDHSWEDVNVKTIDSNIVISYSKRSNSPGSRSPARFAFGGSSVGTNQPSTVLSLRLPDGTDSRSVGAVLTKRDQIVIKARLGPTTRRHSW